MLDIFASLGHSQPAMSSAWLFLLFFFGTFISEDAACLIAGASVSAGQTTFGFAVSSCLMGIFVGDLLLYGIGFLVGRPVFRLKVFRRLISEPSLDRSQQWLDKNAAAAVFISRFVSGLRLPTYLAAGALRADFTRFAAYFLLAAAIWTPILVGTAAYSVHRISPGNTVLAVIFLAIGLRLLFKFTSWKNRRLAVGRIKRIANWEFWPLYVLYFPVSCYVIYLGFRHRCMTLFTVANPGIPASGFVGESKDAIYKSLTHFDATAEHTLRYLKIPKNFDRTKRLMAAVSFKVMNDLAFPLVIKPDRGERGKGVVVVHDRRQLADAIISADEDVIIQEYCDGVEVSVFYHRSPMSKNGRIFSITEKVFPEVIGDGNSTLEELILRDARAVCMATSYFKYHVGGLARRPAKGERVKLIDIGTHSRGVIFRDGEWLKTPELESKTDELCRGIDGFYFGRFDIRAASFDDLKMGRNFKIIELNGVTSESTNIYDPQFNLVAAYRVLFKQWRLAFEIGSANQKLGHQPLTLREFARLVFTRDVSSLAHRQSDRLMKISTTNECA